MATPTAVHLFQGGCVVVFDSTLAQHEAEYYFFPSGVPSGVQIIGHDDREYALLHLTLDAAAHMLPGLYEWLVTAGEPAGAGDWFPGRTDGSTSTGSGSGAVRQRPPGFPPPGDEQALRQWFETALEGGHYLAGAADVFEAFAGEGALEFLGAAGEFLGPIGNAASLAIMFMAVIEAFSAGRKQRKATGYSYGLCWEAFGVANQDKVFYAWAGDSAEELREAFFDGVAEGRSKAQEPRVFNAITLMAARHMLNGDGGQMTAQWITLNEIDEQVDPEFHGQLDWPKPHDDYV